MLQLIPLILAASPLGPVQPVTQHEELLTLWIADSAQILSHPKDSALAAALALVRPRLEEVPQEFPNAQFPPHMVGWATALLGNEKSLRIGRTDEAGPVPLAIQFDWLQDDPQAAKQMAADLHAFVSSLGAPVSPADEKGWAPVEAEIPLPVGFGPRGSAVTVNVGASFEGPFDAQAPSLPTGVAPDLMFRLDVSGVTDMALEPMLAAAPEEAAMLEEFISIFALDELSLHYASGSDGTHTHGVWTLPHYASALRARGVLPEEGISLAHMQAIPVDAVWASLFRIDLHGVLDLVLASTADLLAQQGVDDAVEMFTQLSGIHIERDVLDHLGSTIGMYTSDTTGGGGLTSTVVFLEVLDRPGLLPFLERMQGLANGIGFAEADGYVQVRRWEHGGLPCWTLVFPGLPVPVEISMALSDHLLVIGATPMAMLMGLEQAAGADTCLLDNAHFQASIPADTSGAYGLGFLDTPRLLRDGYGWMALLTSALTNGTRSMRDESRDAGLVLPSYHDLVRGAKATVQVMRIEGDDLVTRTRSDASLLVNSTALLASYMSNPSIWSGFLAGFFNSQAQAAQANYAYDEVYDALEAAPQRAEVASEADQPTKDDE